MPRGDPTAYLPPSASAAERLVLHVCEECGGRFDKGVFEEDFLPEHRGEIAAEPDMASLYRAASRLARKGYLRKVGGSWWRVWDIAAERLPDDARESAAIAAPPLPGDDGSEMIVPGEESRVVVEYSGSRARYLDWDPGRAPAVGEEEGDGAVEEQVAGGWCGAVREVCERRKTHGVLTLGDVRTLLVGWQCDYFTALTEDEQGEFTAIVQDVAPLELLTPYMRIRREQARGIGGSPRTDRYRRYALSLAAAMKHRWRIPPQVKRVVLRELVQSWEAIRQGVTAGDRSAEAELAMERIVLKSLAEVLHAIGLTPQAVTAELVGTSAESTIAAWREAYGMALREFGLSGKDDPEREFGQGADSGGN